MKMIWIVAALTLAACTAEPPETRLETPAAKADAQPPAQTQAQPACVLTPPAEPRACTMDWRPVCGCDGVTYSNACAATAAGVPHYTEGECEPSRLD